MRLLDTVLLSDVKGDFAMKQLLAACTTSAMLFYLKEANLELRELETLKRKRKGR